MQRTLRNTLALLAAAAVLAGCGSPGPRYRNVGAFSEGLAPVQTPAGKWGFVNQRQQWVSEPRFDEARPFQDGRAAARLGSRWGFIDKQGRWQ